MFAANRHFDTHPMELQIIYWGQITLKRLSLIPTSIFRRHNYRSADKSRRGHF